MQVKLLMFYKNISKVPGKYYSSDIFVHTKTQIFSMIGRYSQIKKNDSAFFTIMLFSFFVMSKRDEGQKSLS
jgi:hypothetical protein